MTQHPEIIFISNYWKKSQGGGISTYLINLVQAIKQLTIPVEVISRHGEDPGQSMLPGTKSFFAFKVFRQIRKKGPGSLVSNNDWYCLLPAILYKWTNKVPVVHIFHTWPEKRMSTPLSWLMKFLTTRCDRLIFVSEALKDYYEQEEGIRSSHPLVIHAGFPPALHQSEIKKTAFRSHFGINKNDIVLCTQAMLAHCEKARGLSVLLEAMAALNRDRSVHLLVTKDGKYRKSLEKKASSLGLQDRVHFTGDLENIYLPLSVSDLYLHITYAEGGVSLSILEAISKSIPVIATSTGGIKELLRNEETALLVDPSPESIRNAICNLLDNPDKAKRISLEAKTKLTPLFDWDKNARLLLSVLFPGRQFPLTIYSPKVHNKVI